VRRNEVDVRFLLRVLWVPLLLVTPLVATAQLSATLDLRAAADDVPRAWNAGGRGALGLDAPIEAELRAGYEYGADEPGFGFSLSALARSSEGGRRVGLIDAHLRWGTLDDGGTRVRVGQFFAGSSRENIEAFWHSAYTLNHSALNSWIGEEFRPIGINLTRRIEGSRGQWELDATLYGGNDTGPAVLAWRGFALHSRVSVYGEALPLLPLPSLSDRTRFGLQRSEGSQPFGPDLDGRPGWALGASFSPTDGRRFALYLTDNRGDRDLHDGDEYAWKSRFAVFSGEWAFDGQWTLLGELLGGRTRMGFPPGANVAFDFHAAYLMLSRRTEHWRHSVRAEAFGIGEDDFSFGELNRQQGRALTYAALTDRGDWRYGVEIARAWINRPGNAEFFAPNDQGGWRVSALVRRYF
jgi:hypothetical protein